jgi:hypothetical protein
MSSNITYTCLFCKGTYIMSSSWRICLEADRNTYVSTIRAVHTKEDRVHVSLLGGNINLQMIETYNKCVKHVWLHTHVGASVHKLVYTHGSGHKMNKCSITSMANDKKLIHKSLDTTYSHITTQIDMQYYV